MYQRYEEQYTEQVNKAFLDAIGKEVELRFRYVEEFKTLFLSSLPDVSLKRNEPDTKVTPLI